MIPISKKILIVVKDSTGLYITIKYNEHNISYRVSKSSKPIYSYESEIKAQERIDAMLKAAKQTKDDTIENISRWFEPGEKVDAYLYADIRRCQSILNVTYHIVKIKITTIMEEIS